MSKSRACLNLLLIATVFSSLSYAVTPDRIAGALTSGRTVTLRGNVHRKALPQFNKGPVDPAMRMGTMTLPMLPTVAQRKALIKLVAQQQDPKSTNYRKWLTPEKWADRFGMSSADAQRVATWLQAQGFTMIQVARGRNWVSFTGSAAQVQSAFKTEIHHYNVNGELHYANATAPAVPAALAGIVTGIRGLHDFRPKPMGIKRNIAASPNYNSSLWGDLVAPGDIATIYDINALYASGIDGTGQKLAVMGQTDIYLSDINDFRSGFGLTQISGTNCSTTSGGVIQSPCNDPLFEYKLYGTDPGLSINGDISESDLDVEWAGAVARGAHIIFVNSTDTFISFYDAIDDDLAPVISLSYGFCEFDDNFVTDPSTLQPGPDEVELLKANSEGITFVNSSGDAGAAECDNINSVTSASLATQGVAVAYPASSPEVTGVGGSAIPLADVGSGANASTYWGTTTGVDGGSVLADPGYIPEQAWNDDLEIAQFCQAHSTSTFCTSNGITNAQTAQAAIGISSAGGGASNCALQTTDFSTCVSGFAQPDWQTVTVSGQGSVRFSPDVSFLATPNFPGYIFCTELSEMGVAGSGSGCAPGGAQGIVNALALTDSLGNNVPSIIGGTSASAPVFAGIVALLNQAAGSVGGLGNVNPMLYQLAAVAPSGFHDITSGDIKVYCQPGTPGAPQPSALWCPSTGVLGFSAGTGFDLATGLGSVDVNNLATSFANPIPDFSASADKSSMTVFGGQSDTTTITVAPINSFTGTVSFACAGLPNGANCSFNPTTVTPPTTTQTVATITGGVATTNPATVTITGTTGVLSQVSRPAASIALTVTQGFTLAPTATSFPVAQGSAIDATVTLTVDSSFTGTIAFACSDPAPESTCTAPPSTNASGQVSFHITTTAPAVASSNRGVRIFYAALLPGLLGIVFTLGSRKRSVRGMRLLGLIVVLGFSTLWLGSCGGGSGSSTKDPGTAKGTYTISVSATSGGSSDTKTFQLVVQ